MKDCECPEYAEHGPGCKYQTWIQKRRQEQDIRLGPILSRDLFGETDDRALVADVAFNRHSMNDGHHVSPSDNSMIQVGTDGVRVELVQGIDTEQFKRTLTAAVRATIGLDLSQPLPGTWEVCDIRNDPCDKHDEHRRVPSLRAYVDEGKVPMNDWEEMLKGGLQTALETQTIVFAVSGVSRTCTHQLVRSRKASFHQQSQRASYMGDAPEARMPESVFKNPIARQAFYRATLEAWKAYRTICDQDISYQDARFVLPEGTTNFIMLEYPVREFLNVYAYRGCSMFQWEIVQVMREARRVLVEAHPWLEPYVKISCEKTGPAVVDIEIGTDSVQRGRQVAHHCTFQGWEDVEGQCDFPWAKQEARTFKPAHHRITREGKE